MGIGAKPQEYFCPGCNKSDEFTITVVHGFGTIINCSCGNEIASLPDIYMESKTKQIGRVYVN
jgi:hypothetical protein